MFPIKRPIFYGWFLIPLCLGNIMMTNGLANAFSVIFVALLSEFPWISRAELSGIFSLFTFVYFCGNLVAGPMVDRFGPRITIPFGSALIGLGLFACSKISSPYQLYLFYGLITSLGTCCAGWLPSNVIITNWFRRNRGMAVGIVMCGSGMGVLVFLPLTQILIERFGWRGTFVALAVIIVLWLAPLNAILQRSKPGDKGFYPDGDDALSIPESESSGSNSDPPPQMWTVSKVMRHRSYWMMCCALFCNPFATFTVMLHQVALVVERGFEPMKVAPILGLIGVFTMVGRFASGTLSDRIGREPAYSIFMTSTALAVIFLFLLTPARSWILPLYVVVGGIGMGVGGGMFPAIIADMFPGPSLGRIMGIAAAFGGLGAGLGSWMGGFLHDITGGYSWMLFFVLMAVFGAVISVWIAAPRKFR
ncbi:MAG: MFS transporter [Desulfobacterales bacterium]